MVLIPKYAELNALKTCARDSQLMMTSSYCGLHHDRLSKLGFGRSRLCCING
jgi:hypothetical protein